MCTTFILNPSVGPGEGLGRREGGGGGAMCP